MSEPHPHDLLLSRIQRHQTELTELRDDLDRWGSDAEAVYRYFHESFKTFHVQSRTESIVALFEKINDGEPLSSSFMEIVEDGTGKEFALEHNRAWRENVQPIVNAYLMARWLLDETIRSAEMTSAPETLPEGWAAVLHLFRLR